MIRTHNCGELRRSDIGEKVELAGWVDTRRDHGNIIFVDLRDKHGRTQIVFDPEKSKEVHEKVHILGREWCIKVKGLVSERPEGTVNLSIPTGEIEIEVDELEVLSESLTPPFVIEDELEVSEEIRLRHRYLDLRRPSMQRKFHLKHRAYKVIHDILDEEGFINIETPQLTKSTPEGARDFLVPSRIQPGDFYALPQSPQIFKQLLMVSGFEKYYQIVKCFRDEDLRADRQPEFSQLDLEMSFVEEEDIFKISEKVIKAMLESIKDDNKKITFSRMTHAEAMEKYGTDKPDTRFGLLLEDFTDDLKACGFKVFENVIQKEGRVKGIKAPGYAEISRAQIDRLTDLVKDSGAKGLAYFKVEKEGVSSPISKFFKDETRDLFVERLGAEHGDMIFMVADSLKVSQEALGALRLEIGEEKDLADNRELALLWVEDFPLFKYNSEEKRWVSEHHPFTGFRKEDEKFLEKREFAKIRSRSYDLVLNGNEIASGSIRIHDKKQQRKIFELLGLEKEEVYKKFGFLMEAFDYAAPPHGGIAFGLDRIIAMVTGGGSIREVIAFPKTQRAICPLSGAPGRVEDGQLKELGLKRIDENLE